MNLSTLIGKPVLTRSGERLGYVTSAFPTRDLKKISSVVCADDNEDEFYLPARALLSVSDAVIAGGARLKTPTGIESPIGRRAYSSTGEEIGALTDAELGEIPVLLISSGENTVRCEADRASIGETVIVYASAAERRPAARRTPREKMTAKTSALNASPAASDTSHEEPARQDRKTQSDPSFSIHKDQTGQSSPPSPAIPKPSQTKPRADGFRIDRTNLLGRRVKKSVYDETGTPIILAGERISPQTITLARRKNKLLTLTVNTLTNIY